MLWVIGSKHLHVQRNMACKTTKKIADNIWHLCCPLVSEGGAVGDSEGSDVEIPLPFWADFQVSRRVSSKRCR